MSSLLDHPAVSGGYFFPRPDAVDNPRTVEVPGARLNFYHHDVGSDWTLLHFHGNGEVVADYVQRGANPFFELGVNVLFAEYRGYGGSSGEPRLVEMLGDGQAALNALDLPVERVVAFGRSIGSLYAIELAARAPQLAGLILESGIADPGERLMVYADLSAAEASESELRAEVKVHFNHRAKLQAYANPLLILHTEHDGMVDIWHAERNLEWSASEQKRLLRFASGDHNSIMAFNGREYFAEVGAFLDQLRR